MSEEEVIDQEGQDDGAQIPPGESSAPEPEVEASVAPAEEKAPEADPVEAVPEAEEEVFGVTAKSDPRAFAQLAQAWKSNGNPRNFTHRGLNWRAMDGGTRFIPVDGGKGDIGMYASFSTTHGIGGRGR